LVEHRSRRRRRESKAAERTPEHFGHSAAWLRIVCHSRSACASRGVTSGSSGSLPTAGETFQERAHFVPSANLATTATPLTSGRRNADAGPSSEASVA